MDTLILTTWGTALPLYQREAVCRIAPAVFAQLEAKAVCVEGTATARLTNGKGLILAEVTVQAQAEALEE